MISAPGVEVPCVAAVGPTLQKLEALKFAEGGIRFTAPVLGESAT